MGSLGRRFGDRLVSSRLRAAEAKRQAAVWFYEAKLEAARDQIARYEGALASVRARLAERPDTAELQRRLSSANNRATEYKALATQLQVALRTATRFEYGSLTPPVERWAQRWREDRPKVVLLAYRDYGGSFYAWADAINRTTEWAARLVVLLAHRLGYPNDLTYGAPAAVPGAMHELLDESDVIHLKDEIGFIDGRNTLPPDILTRHGKPLVFTLFGTHARVRQDDPAYRSHVGMHDAVVSITPDLCFNWLRDPRYIPHAVNTADIPPVWVDSRRVGHSPSTKDPQRKGTEDFSAVMDRLVKSLDLELDLIRGVPHAECLQRKAKLGLFFDQAGRSDPVLGPPRVVGWYGNSGLEAAVRGIPTLAHLSDEAFAGARRGGHEIKERCGVINVGRGREDLERTIRWYFGLTADERAEVSRRTRQWVVDFHDMHPVASQLTDLYASLVRPRDGIRSARQG